LVLAAIAVGLLWIEYARRIRIEAPTPAGASAPAVAACPANESVPFSPECMAFIQGALGPADIRRSNHPDSATVASPELH
jgi:hypothetical protein